MEMTYDGALVLPANCVVMDEEEMMYLDGGGTISFSLQIGKNSFVVHALSAIGGTLTISKCTAALAACQVGIATAIELGTAGTGTLCAGVFLLAFGSVIPTIAGAAVTYGIQGLKGKTFKVSISRKGLPDYKPSKPFVI